jgi:hypothetical protein
LSSSIFTWLSGKSSLRNIKTRKSSRKRLSNRKTCVRTRSRLSPAMPAMAARAKIRDRRRVGFMQEKYSKNAGAGRKEIRPAGTSGISDTAGARQLAPPPGRLGK